jgi:ABC-2 type transport system permease protein
MRRSLVRLDGLIRKEIIQLLRDRRSLALLLGLPLVQLFLFSYAVHLAVDHLPTAIVDQSGDPASRALIQALESSQYFDWTLRPQSQAELMQALDRETVKVGIVIPPGFAAHIARGDANVLVLLDGSDTFSVRSGYGGAAQVIQQYAAQVGAAQADRRGGQARIATNTLPISLATRVLYNPDQIDTWFIVPGLIGLILQTVVVQQVALVVVRERESGAIEPILMTPARPLELILSKMIPLLILGCLITVIVVGVGVFWFGVPFQGNLLLFFWLSALFIISSLGLGLLISARATTQWQAYQMSAMPMSLGMFMGGVIYPRETMPAALQLISDLFPVTYFVRIARGIFTKGVGLEFLAGDALALAIYALVVILIAGRSFKPRLD